MAGTSSLTSTEHLVVSRGSCDVPNRQKTLDWSSGLQVSLRIYIAYGTAADQVTALRLQALGAVNGLTVYVPPALTR